jgi:DNA-binding response OmpR family regulator
MKDFSILIIDDEIEIVRTVIDILEDDNPNYNFYQTTKGERGVLIAEKVQPDLIITDWRMPGMSGIELIKTLKSNPSTHDIPVVMLTGVMTNSEHLKTALEAGAIDFIRKPIDKIELMARTRSMLKLAQYYKESLNLKNRELVSITMNIVQNNEFNLKILDKINKLRATYGNRNGEMKEELRTLALDISLKIKGDPWSHFETYFKNVHPRFFNKLAKQFPEITSSEMKLAAYLCLNLSTKEIASITFISTDSIKSARTRLRKRLNLSPEENLNTFLMTL